MQLRRWFRHKRVGVYVDAFNLYYGARDHCGRGKRGWRWLDIASLAESLLIHADWRGSRITKVVYCTALRSNEGNAQSIHDQQTYLDALDSDLRTEVLLGKYSPKTGKGILIRRKQGNKHERILSPGPAGIPDWLPMLEVLDQEGKKQLMVNFSTFEEKGSDVNLASQLLMDVLGKRIDAAIIISNDGDLKFPISVARRHVKVGLVNPSTRPTAGALKAEPSEGVGGHWWGKLTEATIRAHQFPKEIGGALRPDGW